jgi:hypothetical protein
VRSVAALLMMLAAVAVPAGAQPLTGQASVVVDTMPQVEVTELRARFVAEYRRDLGSRVRLVAGGLAEGLVADRNEAATTRDAIARPQELSIDAAWEHADLRVGFSRVVWGRLDEFLPTDVVNPLDLTKFLFEGRAEGRLPVPMVRARWIPSEAFTLESVYVPFFRRGRFDELDEDTAPLAVRPPVVLQTREPPASFENAQGGLRASLTMGRVDWSISAYRGFEPLPLHDGLAGTFPRFTMLGADFETVRGEWGVRGEIAVFVERTLQLDGVLATAKGKSVEAGVGVDRRAGSYRVSGTLMLSNRTASAASFARRDVTLVGVVDRSFARETRTLRALTVYNPGDSTAFARVIGAFSLRDDVALELSGGVFAGAGPDIFAMLNDRDFLSIRMRVFF